MAYCHPRRQLTGVLVGMESTFSFQIRSVQTSIRSISKCSLPLEKQIQRQLSLAYHGVVTTARKMPTRYRELSINIVVTQLL